MFWNPWGVRRHAHLALVHTSIEHSRDWCRSLLILNCQELAAQQPLRPINWCSRLLKMTLGLLFNIKNGVAQLFVSVEL
ncbi:resolvase [Salmonella enterica]|nr:resolvase [Salmonella enterica]